MKKLVFLSLVFAIFSSNANPVRWSFSVNPLDGNRAELVFTANIEPEYYLYATELPPNGPLPTEFTFTETNAYRKIGKMREVPPPTVKFDEIFEMNIGVHTNRARFVQVIEILSQTDFTVNGTIDYMVCKDEMCVPYNDVEFSFSVPGRPPQVAQTATTTTATPATATPTAQQATTTTPAIENVVVTAFDVQQVDNWLKKYLPHPHQKLRKIFCGLFFWHWEQDSLQCSHRACFQ